VWPKLASAIQQARVQAPYAKYDKLYCLPLTTIKMDKGTAIVTSVPVFREKFGITDEMVVPFDIV